MQSAAGEREVLQAAAAGLAQIGVSAHLALLHKASGDLVIEEAVIQPPTLLKAIEQRMGRTLRGIRIDRAEPPMDAVLQHGSVVYVPDAADWLARAVPWLDQRTLRVLSRLPAVGQGVCAPITDGHTALGTVSVWGATIGEADLPAIALLGRYAGGALTLLRLRERDEIRSRLDGALLVARTVAHEINNALAPISGGADLLGTLPALQEQPAAAYLKMIVDASAQAAARVRRLQRIVRLEETVSPLGPERPILDLDRSTEP